ncbi:MAG TPA: M13 family metallopeptidase [Sunxiuqinia sp.]|nr:M13 family metallopeptidase [Sunxiuqinia sp.]
MQKINYLLILLLTMGMMACNQAQKAPRDKGIELADLDTTVSPAADFDHYANGGWKKRNPLPDEKSRYGTFDKLGDVAEQQVKTVFTEITSKQYEDGSIEKKIANFYHSGMDTAAIEAAGISPIEPFLRQVEQLKNIQGLQQLVAQWNKMGISPFFGLYSNADDKNSTMEVAYLHQGGLRMPNRDYYLNTDKHSVEIQQKYREFISHVFQLLGSSANVSEKQAEAIFKLEKQMAKFSMSKLDQRDPYKTYHKMDEGQLAKIAPNYNWAAYFDGIGLGDPGDFIVSQPDFMKGISEMMKTVPVDDWKLYMKWQLVSRMAPYLPKQFVDLSFDFYGKTLSGQLKQRPRWKRVQGTTNSALGEAVGQMYVQKYFPPEAKERMIKLVENLRTSLGDRINKLGWMSDTTKQKALEKLNAITVKVGYPDKWKDYSSMKVTPDSYLDNVLASGRFDFNDMLKKINQPVDKKEWGMTPQTVNAYYNPSANEIVFPAAILQPPFFYMHGDDAINYGAIGVVIGHEMSHGFDDHGRQYDKDGNLTDWWTKDDAARFKKRAKVLADQYSQFTVLDTVKADGELTLGENIADLGGVNVAYNALQMALKGDEKPIDGFTPNQRFFLAYAHVWAENIRDAEKLRRTKTDVHSLGRYRVLGPLRNIEAFDKAFDAKKGDGMYLAPDKRAVIW